MTVVDAELKRRNAAAALVAWQLVDDATAQGLVADPVFDAGARTALAAILARLNGTQLVADDYTGGQVLADQTGAGAVLTFTFASPVQLVLVHANGAATDIARVDPFGGTPSATAGIVAGDEVPTYIPVTATVVKVFAPASMVVSVAGFRRT